MAAYLLTGVAGFIGSTVATLLLNSGHTVVGIDSLNAAYDVRLKQWRLEQLRQWSHFTFHHRDICDRAQLDEVLKRWHNDYGRSCDGVLNLAARAGVRPSVHDPWIYFHTNTTGTLNLLEICRTYDIPKFVLASTSSLYGAHNPLPFHEDADTDRPLSPYAASKKAAEALCYTYHYLL